MTPWKVLPQYHLLPNDQNEEAEEIGMEYGYAQPAREQKLRRTISLFDSYNNSNGLLRRIAIALFTIGALFVAFRAGQWSITRSQYILDKTDLDLSEHGHVFEFEEIYGSKPDKPSNTAWADLFPNQGGFFTHPDISPERGAFAIFHQLHCLDGVRMAYWQLHGQSYPTDPGKNVIIPEDELPLMTSPAHVAHCIDLIRNALICKPDLTIEIKNLTLGGVTGFGTEHQCVDWSRVVDWTSQWESWGQEKHTNNSTAVDSDGTQTHVHEHDHDHSHHM